MGYLLLADQTCFEKDRPYNPTLIAEKVGTFSPKITAICPAELTRPVYRSGEEYRDTD